MRISPRVIKKCCTPRVRRCNATMTSASSSPHAGNTRRRCLHGVCEWVLDGGQGNGEWQHYIGQGRMDARHDNRVDSCHRGVRRGPAVFQSHYAPSCSTVVPTRSHADHVRCVPSLILHLYVDQKCLSFALILVTPGNNSQCMFAVECDECIHRVFFAAP